MWTQTAICMTFSRLRTASAIPLQSKKRPPAAHGACVHGLVKNWRYPSRKAEQKSRKRSLLYKGARFRLFCFVFCVMLPRPAPARPPQAPGWTARRLCAERTAPRPARRIAGIPSPACPATCAPKKIQGRYLPRPWCPQALRSGPPARRAHGLPPPPPRPARRM